MGAGAGAGALGAATSTAGWTALDSLVAVLGATALLGLSAEDCGACTATAGVTLETTSLASVLGEASASGLSLALAFSAVVNVFTAVALGEGLVSSLARLSALASGFLGGAGLAAWGFSADFVGFGVALKAIARENRALSLYWLPLTAVFVIHAQTPNATA